MIPMLAEEYKQGQRLPDKFFMQAKLDGIRATVNLRTGILTSRPARGSQFGNPIRVDHITAAIKSADLAEATIDCELYIHGFTFGQILSAVRDRRNPNHKRLQLWVFDIDLNVPFAEREKIYIDVTKVIDSPFVKPLLAYTAEPKDVDNYHSAFMINGFEGSIIRLGRGGYEHRRTRNLLKYKTFLEMDCKVVGFQEEESGKIKTGTLGALILETDKGVRFTAVPMVSYKQRKEIWTGQSYYMNRTVVVKHLGVQESGKLKSPNVKGFVYE